MPSSKDYPPFLHSFLLNSAKMADVFCLSPLFFVFLQSFRALVPQMRDDEEVPKRLIKRK
jgi:hypothetical protein